MSSQTDSLKANQYYAQGEQYLLQSNPTKAIKQFRKVLSINDSLTAGWRALGSSYELLDQYDSTIVHYQKVVELNPFFSRVIYYEIGRAYYRTGQYKQAIAYFTQFKELQKEHILTYGFNGQREQRYEKKYLALLPQNIQACKTALELLNFSNVDVIHNLGDSINTAGNEYFPYLSNNQQLLFYTSSQFDPNDMNRLALNEDLKCSYAKEEWQRGRVVDSLITTSGNEGMSTFTKDDRQMVFTSCTPIENRINCDLYLAKMEQDSILKTEVLKGLVNTAYWESQASLSCDGTELFFASNRLGGYGSTDIWYSQLLEDGSWSEPINVGKAINTLGSEEAPFITNDGNTLFFSSTGHLGMGEQDIFMSQRMETGQWGLAINLGNPINTASRELGFFLSADNQTGYFASDKKEGKGGMDIYKFKMPKQFEVAPTTFVEGYVKNAATKAAIQSILRTNLKGNFQTDEAGRFFFCLPATKTLKVEIKEEGFHPYADTFYIPRWKNDSLYPLELLLQPIDLPAQVSDTFEVSDTLVEIPLDPIAFQIYFDFNDFGLNPMATEQLANFLHNLPHSNFKKIEILGYADTTGPSNYNLDLSLKRASNVARLLRQYGLEAAQIITQGKGENQDFKVRAFNRRVMIIMYQ